VEVWFKYTTVIPYITVRTYVLLCVVCVVLFVLIFFSKLERSYRYRYGAFYTTIYRYIPYTTRGLLRTSYRSYMYVYLTTWRSLLDLSGLSSALSRHDDDMTQPNRRRIRLTRLPYRPAPFLFYPCFMLFFMLHALLHVCCFIML
jgi:hypothetical protein